MGRGGGCLRNVHDDLHNVQEDATSIFLQGGDGEDEVEEASAMFTMISIISWSEEWRDGKGRDGEGLNNDIEDPKRYLFCFAS